MYLASEQDVKFHNRHFLRTVQIIMCGQSAQGYCLLSGGFLKAFLFKTGFIKFMIKKKEEIKAAFNDG